jgi:hypothetical protein
MSPDRHWWRLCLPLKLLGLSLQEELSIPDWDPAPARGSTRPRYIQPKCGLQKGGEIEDWGGELSSNLEEERLAFAVVPRSGRTRPSRCSPYLGRRRGAASYASLGFAGFPKPRPSITVTLG